MDLPCVWDAPRPYVHPLTTPAGAVLSVEAPADHPWHHALWFTIKFVNGENFWEEYGEFGTLRTDHRRRPTATRPRATLDWIAPDGETVRAARDPDAAHDRRSTTTRTRSTGPSDSRSRRPTVLDRTPFTTWGGYGGLTLRGAPDWTDTTIRLDDGAARDRTLGERSRWLAIDGTAHDGVPTPAPAGVVILDHPDNPRFPTPWYASNRADTYGEGWANFVNAAFLWDEPLDRRARRTARPAVPRARARRRAGPPTASSTSTGDGRPDHRQPRARRRAARLHRRRASPRSRRAHFPDWRIPHTFAGHHVDADVRADLLYTLTHLARRRRAPRSRGAPDRRRRSRAQLAQVDGRNTHTFFSYRVAETLAPGRRLRRQPAPRRRAPTTSAPRSRARSTAATGSSCSTADVLPRNYAAVLSRCELARGRARPRRRPAVLDRPRRPAHARCSTENPRRLPRRLQRRLRSLRHLHRRPLAVLRAARAAHRPAVARRHPQRARARRHGRRSRRRRDPVGPLHRRARRRAHRRARRARASATDLRDDRAGAWVRRGIDAFRATTARLRSRRRRRRAPSPRPGRVPRPGPPSAAHARRARQARVGRRGAPRTRRRHRRPPTRARPTGRPTGSCASSPTAAAGVWVHATPGRRVVIPFVGVTRSHYLPVAPRPGHVRGAGRQRPGGVGPARDQPDPARHHRRAPGPARRRRRRRSTAHWDELAVTGRGLDGATPEPVAGIVHHHVHGRPPHRSSSSTTSTSTTASRASRSAIPETARAPLHVELDARRTARHDRRRRRRARRVGDARTPGWPRCTSSTSTRSPRVRLRARVTPKLRVASTAYGHWYDRLLYTPIADRVLELAVADRRAGRPHASTSRDVELLHLHWPEWFGFDDLAVHERLIARLARARHPRRVDRAQPHARTSSGPTCTTRSTNAGPTPPPA